MITEPRALGAHLLFFRNGKPFTVPSAGTCSKTAKPGAADLGWVNLGTLEDVQVEKKATTIEIFGPTPGQLRRTKVIETKKTLDITFTCQDTSDLAVEAMFGTQALEPADQQWNPLAGAEIEGWLKGQIYDHRDQLWVVIDMWVNLRAEGAVAINSADGQLNKVRLIAYGLHSPLNTGTKPASA
ncbi:MAG: hypothetical protein KF833_18635 [Verrucomicrobiae bacterium]|nr:hypothetical protein [Verrucomicrobiae bacterium]